MEPSDFAVPSPYTIVADDREASSAVPAALAQLPGVRVIFKRLPVGDYVVDGRCVFERKTVVDFAGSIMDGRLFAQARRLVSLTQPAALILEGRSADLAGTQMRRESLQGAMVSLSLIFHLPVLRALDPSETARLMIYAAQQIRRHAWDACVAHARKPKRKRRMQLRILQGLPGIGPSRAEQLLESFGTVEAVMTASQERLENVEGIGSKTAAAIRDLLQEAAVSYRTSVGIASSGPCFETE